MARKYTQQELNFIINNYKTKSNEEIGEVLGLTRVAVRSKLRRLKLKKTSDEIKNNFKNNKHKNGSPGILHPLHGMHRSDDVKEKISKKLTYRTTPYIKESIRINGRNFPKSHFVWCAQPYNLPYVPEGFVIHHYDGNPQNNSPNNLVMLPRLDHQKMHCQVSKIIRGELKSDS